MKRKVTNVLRRGSSTESQSLYYVSGAVPTVGEDSISAAQGARAAVPAMLQRCSSEYLLS
eukprot:3966740-Prymnesium_polylepis.1